MAAQAHPQNVGKKVVFKNCASFTDCISEINNTQTDNAKYVNAIMPMYNVILNVIKYSKSSGTLWQYYREERTITDVGAIADFSAADNSASFKFKQKITGATDNDDTKNVEIIVSLKYLSNFWRTLEMSFINFEVNLILTGSANCVIFNASANRKQQYLQ